MKLSEHPTHVKRASESSDEPAMIDPVEVRQWCLERGSRSSCARAEGAFVNVEASGGQ